jgi:hypothetical protein
MRTIDITPFVEFGLNDDENLPLTRCICGATFAPWEFIISIYRGVANPCPQCKRKLCFGVTISVFEVEEEPESFSTTTTT